MHNELKKLQTSMLLSLIDISLVKNNDFPLFLVPGVPILRMNETE